MTIRDIKILINIIKDKIDLGLPLDSSVNENLKKNQNIKILFFQMELILIHEFFNLERKIKNNILSKSVQILGKNHN